MIDPCGIKDRGVGSIKQILQKASHGTEIYDTLLMDMAYNSMIKEFAEIFQLDLDTSPDCSFQVKKILNQLHYVLFSTQGVCYSRLC
jgi:lipoyl(octanoyl) transferase